jgi:hypothetical protein
VRPQDLAIGSPKGSLFTKSLDLARDPSHIQSAWDCLNHGSLLVVSHSMLRIEIDPFYFYHLMTLFFDLVIKCVPDVLKSKIANFDQGHHS